MMRSLTGDSDLQFPCLMDKVLVGVMCTKDGLPSGEYVFFHRDNRSDETKQNAGFRGRVQLMDGGILRFRNVSSSDNGTYECCGLYRDSDPDPEVTCCA
ncbi:hypothetical protein L3Q82_003725 [Scortum barcoo]|uniref:Uncharacterized protein n=1 Tax=Scortum barcoo TaxID=214431 RepID=A0ACB8X6X1_9TELE|nr:hypothetical protein L3Q82_003725 [Scortum barcoo]